jgi:isopenicillin N synthase-like dioxygenase
MIKIPVIDLSKARNGDINDKKVLAEQINQACKTVGFFTIKGHGIDKNVFDDLYQYINAFFALPQDQKEQCVTDVQPCHFQHNGYSALLGESANALMGKGHLPSDSVEKFSNGKSLLDDGFELPFPSGPSCDGFRAAMKTYYQACRHLASMLSELFALALGLPQDYFVDKIDQSEDYLRLHHYPALAQGQGFDQRVYEHKDISILTILHDAQPGLEVLTTDGQWVKAITDEPDEFIVNIGDFMQRWTNDEWRSTLHRVGLSETERQSAIFFAYVNPDTVLETFPKFLKDGKSKYEPVVFDAYVGELTRKLFGH